MGQHEHAATPGFNGQGMRSYDVTELIVREDIMAKAKELADLLATSEEVEHFRKAEKKINEHPHIQELIRQIKKKQKELVAFQHTFKNEQMVQKIEGEIAALQDELDGIPLVQEFQQSQSDINYLLQLVINVIRDTLAEKINVETGGSEAAVR